MKKLLFCMLVPLFGAISCEKSETVVARQPDARGEFTDPRDNTTYAWVRYGDLEWLCGNLRYLAAGTVPDTTPVPPSIYDDGKAAVYFKAYGYLYTHAAAMTACPDGWRLPTDAEWSSVGDVELRAEEGVALELGGFYYSSENARTLTCDAYASALGYYWSATEDDSKVNRNYAYARKFRYASPEVERLSIAKDYYLSVRCVRDRTDH